MSNGDDGVAAVVLAGGAGTRLGGADKGLVAWRGRPLVAHALERLADSGVDAIVISANRHLEQYAAYGRPVLADEEPAAFRGPLAGIARALAAVGASYLFTVPVDVPAWPLELPRRLREATERRMRAVSRSGRLAGWFGEQGKPDDHEPPPLRRSFWRGRRR